MGAGPPTPESVSVTARLTFVRSPPPLTLLKRPTLTSTPLSRFTHYVRGPQYALSQESHIPSASFRVTPVGYKTTFSTARRRQLIDGLAYLDFQGPIDLKTPDVEIFLAEEHEDCEMEEADDQGPLQPGKHPTRSKHFWLGRKVCTLLSRRSFPVTGDVDKRQICEGRRDLTDLFDLKKRAYIGNTSMESSLSVLVRYFGRLRDLHLTA